MWVKAQFVAALGAEEGEETREGSEGGKVEAKGGETGAQASSVPIAQPLEVSIALRIQRKGQKRCAAAFT